MHVSLFKKVLTILSSKYAIFWSGVQFSLEKNKKPVIYFFRKTLNWYNSFTLTVNNFDFRIVKFEFKVTVRTLWPMKKIIHLWFFNEGPTLRSSIQIKFYRKDDRRNPVYLNRETRFFVHFVLKHAVTWLTLMWKVTRSMAKLHRCVLQKYIHPRSIQKS